jgi:hypothetical protein
MRKQELNTSYAKKAISRENARIAAKIADRAIQQTIDADELEGRMQGLFEPEIIEMACNIVNGFFLKSEEHNFFEAWLSNDKMSIWEAFKASESVSA